MTPARPSCRHHVACDERARSVGAAGPKNQFTRGMALLDHMRQYCENEGGQCRHQVLLRYFGDGLQDGRCRTNCDVCREPDDLAEWLLEDEDGKAGAQQDGRGKGKRGARSGAGGQGRRAAAGAGGGHGGDGPGGEDEEDDEEAPGPSGRYGGGGGGQQRPMPGFTSARQMMAGGGGSGAAAPAAGGGGGGGSGFSSAAGGEWRSTKATGPSAGRAPLHAVNANVKATGINAVARDGAVRFNRAGGAPPLPPPTGLAVGLPNPKPVSARAEKMARAGGIQHDAVAQARAEQRAQKQRPVIVLDDDDDGDFIEVE